jgi:5'-nucleotidase
MIILIDQDGPLANFEVAFLYKWRQRFPEEEYIPLAERATLHVRDDYPQRLRESVESIYRAKGFYENLPILPGAREAIRTMMELGHEVLICTSPLSAYENCVLEKYLWVEKHLGREFTERVVLTKAKALIKGDFLVDDAPQIPAEDRADWQHVIFDAPYNRQVSNKPRLTWSNWRDVLKI